MIDKELVRDNFSRAADSYDDYAVVQDYMGQELLSQIEVENEINNILEVGAGTGLFTEKSITSFSNSEHLLVDISPAMINQCRQKFASQDNIDFLTADAEKLSLGSDFDLILSNAAVQWFKNLEQGIKNFLDHLTAEGKMYFSTFGAENFKELRYCFNQVLGSSFSQNFLSKNELTDLVGDYCSQVVVQEEEYIEKFSTVRDFLKATKKIGANSARKDKPQLTPRKLKQIEKIYVDKYSQAGQIVVTHHLLFVELKKEF